MMNPTEHPVYRIWSACSEPAPYEADGELIPPRGRLGTCAVTGGAATYRYLDGLSTSFTLARAANRAFRFSWVSRDQRGLVLSAAAVFVAKTIALRSAPWIVEPTSGGDRISFHCSRHCPKDERSEMWHRAWRDQKPASFLTWLLRDRPAGTIAGLPAYGIDHGGEVNLARCCWPGGPIGEHAKRFRRDRVYVPTDPLVKLQAKHVALYAPASTRAGMLARQVDSDAVMEVECRRWRAAIPGALQLLDALMQAGLAESAAKRTILLGHADPKHPVRAHAIAATIPIHLPPSLTREPFWPIFAGALYV